MTTTWTADEYERIVAHWARVTSSLEPRDIVEAALDAVADLLRPDQAVVTELDGNELRVLGSRPDVEEIARGVRVPLGHGLVGRAASEGSPVYSGDLRADPRVDPAALDRPGTQGDRSFLAVPLTAPDGVIGVIHILSSGVDAFGDREKTILVSIAPAIAAALNNARVVAHQRDIYARHRILESQQALFVWLLSVDLRRPLSELSRVIARLEGTRSDEIRKGAREILRRGSIIAALIDEILELAMEESAPELALAPVDVVAVLSTAGKAPPGPPVIALTEPARLLRVISYLVPEGTVGVRVKDDWVVVDLPAAPSEAQLIDALARLAGGRASEPSEIVFERVRA